MVKKILIGAILFICIFFLGCSTWVKIQEKSIGSESLASFKGDEQSNLPIAIIKEYKIDRNGVVKLKPTQVVLDRIVKDLRTTGLFSAVLTKQQADADQTRTVQLSFAVTEELDTNPVTNAARRFCVGFTFFLLAPVISQSYDFSASMELHVVKWDGMTKHYKAESKGKGYSTELTYYLAESMVTNEVTTNNINSVLSQMIQDSKLYIE